jgi:hypothetical protein
MKHAALYPVLALLLAAPLGAQTPDPRPPRNNNNEEKNDTTSETRLEQRFWQASVPGGEFMVAIDRISSISQHTYITGGFVVHEVNVDTLGQALARFYYIETQKGTSATADDAVERAQQILNRTNERTGVDTETMVVKTPATTHAKCIEYRLSSLDELDALFKSVKTTWETSRGRKFTVK